MLVGKYNLLPISFVTENFNLVGVLRVYDTVFMFANVMTQMC